MFACPPERDSVPLSLVLPFLEPSSPARSRERSRCLLPSLAAVPVSEDKLQDMSWLTSSPADIALSQKLGEELRYEKEENTEAAEPAFVKAIVEQGVWTVSLEYGVPRCEADTSPQIEDVAGQDEVAISRKFGSEKRA